MLHLRSGQHNTVNNDEVAGLTSQVTLQLLVVKKRFLSSPKHPERFNGPPSLLLQRPGSRVINLYLVTRLIMNGSMPSLVLMACTGTILHLTP
jgi:hypothetical protein